MSIKTGQKITATDINNLKAAIRTLYSNRPVNVGWDYALNDSTNNYYYSYVYNMYSRISGETINGSDHNLIDACLIINDIPNLKTQNNNPNETILADGTSTDLLTWINNIKDNKNTSSNHGCRGACVGLCTGSCAGTCLNGCSGCTNSCHSTCKNGCDRSSGAGCGDCSGSCGTGCTGACGQSSCRSGCATTACKSGCYGQCKDGCQGSCKKSCYGTLTNQIVIGDDGEIVLE